jgi:hypothetical protein
VRPYTHRYAYLPADPRWVQAWPQILANTRTIVEHVRRTGVVIAGPDGLRRPVFDPAFGVEFNGDATTDLAGDTFTMMAPLFTRRTVSAQAACATGGKPYDLAVAAVLLRCHQLVPDVFVLDSDGGWDTDWLTGRRQPATGRTVASPRDLVGQLFEPYPNGNPFTDITQFLGRRR